MSERQTLVRRVEPYTRKMRRALDMSRVRVAPVTTAYALLAVLVVAGVLLRLWFISVSPLDPRYSNADDGDYYRRALRFAVTGAYVDDAWLIRPPLHVFFFAFWLRLALVLGVPQPGLLFVQLAQTALAAVMTLIGFGLARRLFASMRAGLLFAGFLALWYPLIEQTTVLFSEHLYLFFFLLHLWLLVRYDQEKRRRDLALAGAALGAAALTRSPALYAVVFVVGWLVVHAVTSGAASRWQAAKEALKPALLVVAACLTIVAPWTTRNYLTYGHLFRSIRLGRSICGSIWTMWRGGMRISRHCDACRRRNGTSMPLNVRVKFSPPIRFDPSARCGRHSVTSGKHSSSKITSSNRVSSPDRCAKRRLSV